MKQQRISYNTDLTAFTRCLLGCYKQEVEMMGKEIKNPSEIEQICSNIAKYIVVPDNVAVPQNLMLAGGVGSGKTTLLKALFRTLSLDAEYDFTAKKKKEIGNLNLTRFVSAKELLKQTQTLGEFPNLYVDYNFFLLIDDVGSEETFVKSYGTTIRVMEDIICMRADRGMRTIISTNYDKDALGRYYQSVRVADRLKDYALIEMNNQSYRGI